MKCLLITASLAGRSLDSEETVWITVLVFTILAGGAAIWSFVRKKSQITENEEDSLPGNTIKEQKLSHPQKNRTVIPVRQSYFETIPLTQQVIKPAAETAGKVKVPTRNVADLKRGMELLASDFLLSVVSDNTSDEATSVTMRKLCFQELMRRNQLNCIDSSKLKVYSVNKNNIYGKTIQCAALQELSLRTSGKLQTGSCDIAIVSLPAGKSENEKVPAIQ
jgi:hypothetical protein